MTTLNDLSQGDNACHAFGRPDVIQPDGTVPPHDVLGLASPCDTAPSILPGNARVQRLRHPSAPSPMGCRWCGVAKQEHPQLWVPGKSWHGWTEPTRAQIAARLRSRLSPSQCAEFADTVNLPA
ncbi:MULTISPECIES: hypothetical protein [unclassified Micromonospora]|uniref:hypothetical protein n=1 Tax=unclassified Micromonospora TaxID=2617518 RepID=UPI0033FB8AEA